MSSSDVVDLLEALTGAFDELGVRWYLFGAQAVLIHGRPRLTDDVDVTVELGNRSTHDLAATLESRGFALPDFADDAFVSETRVLPFTHAQTGLSLDVVLAGPGLEALFLSRAIPSTVGNVEVPVITAEDLVVLKILGGRPKDLDDVRGILKQQASLNLERVRGLLTDLEAALGQSDLRVAFERLLSERGS